MPSAKIWFQAARPFSFTASLTPVLVGTALAAAHGHFHVLYFLAALFGGLFIHAGSNLFNDVFDYRIGADTTPSNGSGLLPQKVLTPKQVYHFGLVMFLLAFLIGIYLVAVRGWVIVALGTAGLLGGYFYTAGPIHLKYRALAEPIIFLLFGLLMVWGGWYVQTGTLAWEPFIVSLPIAFLVAAIVNVNNLRDAQSDRKVGFKTISIGMGHGTSSMVYYSLIALAYLSLGVMVLMNLVEWFVVVALLSLPAAIKVIRLVSSSVGKPSSHLAIADVLTAQLHMKFGLLFTAGIVLGRWL